MTEPATVLFLCSGNYYRSRFAELLFNHLAERAGIPFRADSAGLCIDCHTRNPGPLSPHARVALEQRGIALPTSLRTPRDVQIVDVRNAAITIALKESEHRPMVEERLSTVRDRVEYWNVDDVGESPPDVALPIIEHQIRDLVDRLALSAREGWRSEDHFCLNSAGSRRASLAAT